MSMRFFKDRHPLERTKPEFLGWIDTDPDRAWEAFHEFTWRLLSVHPPRIFQELPLDTREDMIADIIHDCCRNNFEALRRYRDIGSPFAAWVATIARNRAKDFHRKQRTRNEHRPDPASPPEDDFEGRDLLEKVRTCLAQLGSRCRTLVKMATLYKPAEIAFALRVSQSENKRISDKIRACRKTLWAIVRREGFADDVASYLGMSR